MMQCRRRRAVVPHLLPGQLRDPGPGISAGLGDATLAELVWEIAGRLDRLGPPVIYLYERTDPELEELTVYHGTGPLRGYRGFHSPVGTPDVVIMPASEVRELLSAARCMVRHQLHTR